MICPRELSSLAREIFEGICDWMVNQMNRQGLFYGKAVIIQPIMQGLVDVLNEQDGLYTLLLRSEEGRLAEKRQIITSVAVVSTHTHWNDFLECTTWI